MFMLFGFIGFLVGQALILALGIGITYLSEVL